MSAQVNNFTKQERFLVCQWQAKKNFVTWYTDCSSFYLLKYCLVICRILGILQITYFYPYPRIRISFPERNPSIAARISAWKDRIECVSGNFWNKWIPLYCSLNSPKFLWCRSDSEEYVSFVDLCNLYRSSWSFNLRLPFKKEDGDQWSSCAGKVSRFFFSGRKFRALHVTTASLQFCCCFFRLLAGQVVLEKRWPLRWLSVELTWLSWRGIWLELPEWSWYRAVTVYKVHRSHTAVRGV